MLEKWMRSNNGRALMLIRLGVGIVFFAHGARKLFGFFGGSGMEGTIEQFANLGIWFPTPTAWMVSVIEFAGGVGLLIGFLTREWSLLLSLVMLGAIVTVTGKNGFFIQNQGFEYNFILIAACMSLFYGGGGSASFDRIMFPRERWRFVDPSKVKLDPPPSAAMD